MSMGFPLEKCIQALTMHRRCRPLALQHLTNNDILLCSLWSLYSYTIFPTPSILFAVPVLCGERPAVLLRVSKRSNSGAEQDK